MDQAKVLGLREVCRGLFHGCLSAIALGFYGKNVGVHGICTPY